METWVWVPRTHIKPAGGMHACNLSSFTMGREQELTVNKRNAFVIKLRGGGGGGGYNLCLSQVWPPILYKLMKKKKQNNKKQKRRYIHYGHIRMRDKEIQQNPQISGPEMRLMFK